MSLEVYSTNLIIVEHFDELKNQIDVHTENLLSKTDIDNDEKQKINKQRSEIIDKIEEIQNLNLKSSSQSEFEIKWNHLFEFKELNDGKKEEFFKDDLIKIDCLIIRDEEFSLKLNLWIIKGYLRFEDRDFFSNFDSSGQVLKEKVVRFNKLLIKIKLFNSNMTRNICILNQICLKTPNHLIKDFRELNFESIYIFDLNPVFRNIQYQITDLDDSCFRELFNLKAIKMYLLFLKQVNKTHFNGLENLENIDLNTNRLSVFPFDLLTNMNKLEVLNLSCNEFTSIGHGTFCLMKRLRELDLSFNDISVIDQGAFDGLENLKLLNISECSLSRLESNAFRSLGKLKKLHLGANQLKELHKDTFSNLSNLELLELSSNRLKIIEPELFANLKNLKKLDLNCNELKNIHVQTFEKLESLAEMDLNSNEIIQFESGTFCNNTNLKKLLLYCNQLSELTHDSLFQNLKNLTDLDLSCNQLYLIDFNTFSSLNDLERLDLGFNKLIRIDMDLFARLSKLLLVDLNGNKISEIDKINLMNQKFVKKFVH